MVKGLYVGRRRELTRNGGSKKSGIEHTNGTTFNSKGAEEVNIDGVIG